MSSHGFVLRFGRSRAAEAPCGVYRRTNRRLSKTAVALCLALIALADLGWAQDSEPEPIVGSAAEQASQWVERGQARRAVGDLRAACRAFDEAVAVLPAWWVARLEAAECSRLVGTGCEVGLPHVRSALATDPDKGRLHELHGVLLEECGSEREAYEAYRAAIAVAPWLPRARRRLAATAASLESWGEAATHYRAWLGADHRNPVAWAGLASALEAAGELDEAATSLEQWALWSRYPIEPWARLYTLYLRLGRDREASAVRAQIESWQDASQ